MSEILVDGFDGRRSPRCSQSLHTCTQSTTQPKFSLDLLPSKLQLPQQPDLPTNAGAECVCMSLLHLPPHLRNFSIATSSLMIVLPSESEPLQHLIHPPREIRAGALPTAIAVQLSLQLDLQLQYQQQPPRKHRYLSEFSPELFALTTTAPGEPGLGAPPDYHPSRYPILASRGRAITIAAP